MLEDAQHKAQWGCIPIPDMQFIATTNHAVLYVGIYFKLITD